MAKTTGRGRRAVRSLQTCRDEVELAGDYLGGSLTMPVLAAFEQHLARCRDCAAFIDTYRKTMELTARFLKAPPAAGPTAIRI